MATTEKTTLMKSAAMKTTSAACTTRSNTVGCSGWPTAKAAVGSANAIKPMRQDKHGRQHAGAGLLNIALSRVKAWLAQVTL